MITVAAFVPDLMDRSRISGVVAGSVRYAAAPQELVAMAAGCDVVVVDLSRPGVLDVLADVSALGVRTIGFGSHVDADTLDEARAAGCDQVMARSVFFSRLAALLG
jgi:2-keto-3-deoxy-6-phosphogluconate aldolase